ncbi:hypothetical protein [Algiphilus sp.]|uniref:hypothetical protein n=1 Tax=Algiphilus sp. TaxID=1872431 RepID=UPI003BA864AC
MSEIVIFEGDSKSVEVRLEGATLWLARRQMGELFGPTPEKILMHLQNIFAEKELPWEATAKDFLVVCEEGKRQPLNEQGLTALTLLIAESDPKAKDPMVRLTMNLIAEPGDKQTDS